MARRDINEAAEKYKGDGGEFFKLVNDKDTDIVRFLIEGELVFDEDWFVVHEIEIEKKKRWVRCTEQSDCPICANRNKAILKLFLQLIAKSDPDKRKLWERGQNFIPQITEAINKYGDLCNRPYEVERDGAVGDTKTKYGLYALDRDNKRLEDLPIEKQKLLGPYGEGFVLKLSFREMQDVADGRFKPERPESGRSERGGRGDDRGRSDDRDRDAGRDSGRSERGRSDDRGRGDERPSDRSERRDEPDQSAPASRRGGRATNEEIF